VNSFEEKQRLADPARYYGDGGTIHSTGHVDVEVDEAGEVVALWFRCQLLPFRVFRRHDDDRYGPEDFSPGRLTGVEILDPPR
jgi:hypothetical protein